MLKFSQINEAKKFYPDPSIIKRYASFIIPLYLNGELQCDEKLIDEWLEMHKSKERVKNIGMICDLEILAVKQIFDNPTTSTGFSQLKQELEKKCPKLEKFMRKYLTNTKELEK